MKSVGRGETDTPLPTDSSISSMHPLLKLHPSELVSQISGTCGWKGLQTSPLWGRWTSAVTTNLLSECLAPTLSTLGDLERGDLREH